MNGNSVARIWTGIRGLLRRLAGGVARLSTGRFILLCLLGLIAAGVLEGILYTGSGGHIRAPVSVVVDKQPDANSADPGKAKERVEVSIGGHKIVDVNDLKELKDLKDLQQGPDHSGRELPLAQIVFFLIVVLWAVRIITRTQIQAEQRVVNAECDVEIESLRRQVAEAQLQTLQAQVEPHFLFNTLAAVEHLTETDPPRAAVMLRHLIDFLRGSLPSMREQRTTLGREVDICRSYLAIMQIRMEDRLTVSIDLPEGLRELPFPPMMLQSLVENAVKHGLEPKPQGGAVAVSARLQENRLRVTVADTGLGIAEGAPQGIGLSNIRDRLKRLYGPTAALILAPNAPTGAHVTIEIPHAQSTRDSGR
ncbi:sensor histidine kinase YpdA [mine drainage metagenome]|uniref:Sensor histidine kinase YpdA n=1 Tax=mine drainage metagenome TaxID=410659 RepID=A0A1J5RM20_9ZZZZ